MLKRPAQPPRGTLRRSTVATVSAGLLVAALAGCAPIGTPATSPSPEPSGEVTPSVTAAPSESASPGAEPGASPTPTPSTTPVPAPDVAPINAPCAELVSLQTMYDFDPNFGLLNSYVPTAGTPAATAVGFGGVACRWQQQTSGQTIDIAVAHPPTTSLAELESKAGTLVSSGAYFSKDADGYGVVQLFEGQNWIVARSEFFLSPADAAPLTDSVTAAVR